MTECPRKENLIELQNINKISRVGEKGYHVGSFHSWTTTNKNGIVLSANFFGGVSSFGRPQ